MILSLFIFHTLSGCTQDSDNTDIDSNGVQNLTALECFEIIEGVEEGDVIILDIRTPGEYEGGRIPGAINLDYLSPEFRNNLKKLDSEKTYLIYCRTGGRSGRSLAVFEEEGFTKIYHMNRGIAEWLRENLPLEE